MIKKLGLFSILVFALLLSGCSGDSTKKAEEALNKVKSEASSVASKVDKGPVLRDEAAMKQFEKDVKDKFGGFKVFRETFGGSVYIYENRIDFTAVDPKNTKNVDKYSWTKSGFGKSVPVKVTVSGGKTVDDFAEYQTDMSMVNFAVIPKFVEAAEKAAKEQGIEGAKPIDFIRVKLESRNSENRVIEASIKGTRNDIDFVGDIKTGEIISVKKK